MCVFLAHTLHPLPRAFHLSIRILPRSHSPFSTLISPPPKCSCIPLSEMSHFPPVSLQRHPTAPSSLHPVLLTISPSCQSTYISFIMFLISHPAFILAVPYFILLLSSHFRTENCSLTRMSRCRADPLGFPCLRPRPRPHSTALQLRIHLRSRWLTFDVHHTDTLKKSKPNRIETGWICRYTLLQDGVLNSHFRLYNYLPTAYHRNRDRRPTDRIVTTQPNLEVGSAIFERKQPHLKHTPCR